MLYHTVYLDFDFYFNSWMKKRLSEAFVKVFLLWEGVWEMGDERLGDWGIGGRY